MPIRLIDGEGIWGSNKIEQLEPRHRPEYAWIYAIEARVK